MTTEHSAAISRLKTALLSKNGDEVEFGIADACASGLIRDFTPILVELMNEDWHTRHEDIALCLQELKDPRAVERLQQTAVRKFEYLDYDDSKALARKCTWALADIGEPGRSSLELLRACPDQEIASYAQRRLDRWNEELNRKAEPQDRSK